MRRTQIYLTNEMHLQLSEESKQLGVTISEIIRRKISMALSSKNTAILKALDASKGSWKKRGDVEKVVRTLRKDRAIL